MAFHATLIKLTNKADFRVARPSFSSSLSAAARALLSSVQHASHYNQEPLYTTTSRVNLKFEISSLSLDFSETLKKKCKEERQIYSTSNIKVRPMYF